MSWTVSIVDTELLRAITWTLVHFLWQGTALAAALALATRVFRPSASARHAAGIITMAAMLAAPVVTFSTLVQPADPSPRASLDTTRVRPSPAAASADAASLPAALPVESDADVAWFTLVPVFWMAGVIVFGFRLTGGWLLTRRLATRGTRPVDAAIDALARDVARRLGLRRAVRVAESARVTTPAMFGWVRPIVLLPAATIAGLTPVQLEAVIAHELVHVRRHDYLVNLLQAVAEAVLFFHPAVWWVSRGIRREREHCCDDAVVRVCDRMEYVRALTHLAKAGQMQVALAASDGSLLHRVRRLLGQPEPAAPGWVSMLVVLTMVGGLASMGPTTIDRVEAMAPGATTTDAADPPMPPARAGEQASAAPVVRQSEAPTGDTVPADPTSASRPAPPARPVTAPVPHEVAVEDGANDEDVLRSHLAALQDQLEAVKRQQVELERRRDEAQTAAMVENTRTELDAARAEHARQQALVEIGRADEQALVETQARVRTLERTLQQVQAEAMYRQRAAALQQQQAEQMAQYDQLQQRYGRLLAERDEARQLQVEIQRQAARRQADRSVQPLAPIDDSAAIAPGDIVRAEIEGESDLPSDYRVGDDGSIRVPLLGRFVVQGRTPAEVRAEIRRALDRTGLMPGASVRVEVRRAR